MKFNKVIVFGVVGALVFVSLITTMSGQKIESVGVNQHSTTNEPEKIDSLVGDTTADNYKGLQATVKKTQEEYKQSVKKYDSVLSQNKIFKKQLELLTKRFENYSGETLESRKATGGLIKKTSSIPIEKANDPKTPFLDKIKNIRGNTKLSDSEFHLNEPLKISDKFKQNSSFNSNNPSDLKNKQSGWLMPIEQEGIVNSKVEKIKALEKKKIPIDSFPAMTVSDNSVLYDAKALTYLVGRIPVGGRVSDPYPVKIIVGHENLMANGFDLPGVEGMVFSGYATGDMNMKCVRAEMNSYTFIFNDGRQVTHRQKPRTGKGAQEPMAYISDRWGLPCVVGTFVSNFAEYIGFQTGLSALSAAGSAYAAAQTTVSTSIEGSTNTSVTGSSGKYAMGNVVSGAVGNVIEWVAERQLNSFDAVVVKSGTEISVHLNRNINIDYKKSARKINYNLDVAQVHLLD